MVFDMAVRSAVLSFSINKAFDVLRQCMRHDEYRNATIIIIVAVSFYVLAQKLPISCQPFWDSGSLWCKVVKFLYPAFLIRLLKPDKQMFRLLLYDEYFLWKPENVDRPSRIIPSVILYQRQVNSSLIMFRS